jgi:hypothetical protein
MLKTPLLSGLRPKSLLAAIFLIGACFLPASEAQALPIKTDPWDASNPFSLKTSATNQILPRAFAQYAPSGNYLNRAGFGAALTPPNPTAVDTIVLALVKASSGQTAMSKAIWSFAIAFTIFGMTLSGLITAKVISAGKEPPGLGAVKWVGKCAMCLIMISYVASAMPRTLISFCDSISTTGGEWVSQNNRIPSAMQVIADRVATNYELQYMDWAKEVLKRIMEHYPQGDPRRSTVSNAFMDAAQQNAAVFDKLNADLTALVNNGATNMSAEDYNQQISDLSKEAVAKASDNMNKLITNGFKAAGESDSTILGNILDAPTMDLSGLAYPVQIIRTAIYIAVVYTSISIWGMPLAILVWTSIFSLPSQWGMNNILYSGIKVFFITILTLILVMVYTSGTLSAETERSNQFQWGDLLNPMDMFQKMWAGSDTGILGGVVNYFTGSTTDLIIAAMLIVSAPAQAAAIVKGANGVAESGKSAMMAGASGWKQNWGSIANASPMGGGSGSSLGGGSVSLSNFQSNMSPRKP